MAAKCLVRLVTAGDSRAVYEIRNHAANRPFFHDSSELAWEQHQSWFHKTYLSGGPAACFVLESDDEIIGYCRLDRADDGASLLSLALHPSVQGRGLGKRMLREVMSLQSRGGVLRGEVLETNGASLALFRSLGFSEQVAKDGVIRFEWTRRSSIAYGLKLWSGNVHFFEEAVERYHRREFDFIEFYFDPSHPMSEAAYRTFEGVPIGIHAPHALDDFRFGEPELAIWDRTKALATSLESKTIVMHPGYLRTIPDVETFERELAKVDDPRVLIENMPAFDTLGDRPFAHDLETLARIRVKKPICFDIEKAAKAACFENIEYLSFIREGIERLGPNYFHISGADVDSSTDQHMNLWEGSMDLAAIRNLMESYAEASGRVLNLVFETPKAGRDLSGDLANMKHFREAKSLDQASGAR